jgi:hypothetical protein
VDGNRVGDTDWYCLVDVHALRRIEVSLSDDSKDNVRNDPPPPWPAQIPYRNPQDDRPTSPLQVVAAFATITALCFIAAVALLIYFAFAMDYRGEGVPQGRIGSFIAITIGGTLLATALIIGIRWQSRADRRHRAMGIWIGIGITCLVEGLCFASM